MSGVLKSMLGALVGPSPTRVLSMLSLRKRRPGTCRVRLRVLTVKLRYELILQNLNG